MTSYPCFKGIISILFWEKNIMNLSSQIELMKKKKLYSPTTFKKFFVVYKVELSSLNQNMRLFLYKNAMLN